MILIKRCIVLSAVGLLLTACRHNDPVTAAPPQPAPLVTDVVVKKPFIAMPHPFTPGSAEASVLLRTHARTDSPIALAEFDKQKSFPLSAFNLNPDLSASTLQKKLGPPAQLADYSDTWFVYRLNYGKEIWLHFSQPDNLQLTEADIVGQAEDGYTRDRIFTADNTR